MPGFTSADFGKAGALGLTVSTWYVHHHAIYIYIYIYIHIHPSYSVVVSIFPSLVLLKVMFFFKLGNSLGLYVS